jgi:archaemetzincin
MKLLLIVIHLIFFSDFTESNRTKFEAGLRVEVKKHFGADLVLDKSIKLPANAYYKPRGRYKADSLLKFLDRDYRVIGVTSKDISTDKGQTDWGIMGMARCPGSSCVVSLYRVKNISRLVKVAVHELGHTYGLKHCSTKDCLMQASDGSVSSVDKEKEFCTSCKAILKTKIK